MKRLLIVDDSQDLLEAMETILIHYDFEVRTAKNTKSLLNEVRLFEPAIIIIDVFLNEDDGRDICKSFRQNPENKNITLILSSATPKYLNDFEIYGADGVIEKPFGLQELIDKIESSAQFRKKSLVA